VKDKDSDIELEVDNEYIMSPKDLKTVHFLNKILDAGVRVLKIEGRGRSPEYVKTVSSVYRKAVNAYFSGEFGEPQIREWDKELEKVYNRGFWNGYYLGQRLGEWTEKYGSQATQKKLYLGKVTNYFSKIGVAEVKVDTNELELNDNVVFIGDTTGVHEEKVKEIRIELSPVQKAVKGDVFSIPVSNLVRRGDKMYKVIEVENQKRDFLSNANND